MQFLKTKGVLKCPYCESEFSKVENQSLENISGIEDGMFFVCTKCYNGSVFSENGTVVKKPVQADFDSMEKKYPDFLVKLRQTQAFMLLQYGPPKEIK